MMLRHPSVSLAIRREEGCFRPADRYRTVSGRGGLERPRGPWSRRGRIPSGTGGPVSLPPPRGCGKYSAHSSGRRVFPSSNSPNMATPLRLDDLRRAWDARDPRLVDLLVRLVEQTDELPDKPVRD